MPIEQRGTEREYYLIAFGADGGERADDTDALMSDKIAERLRTNAVTDVFVFSHGWRGDVEAAKDQYNKWVTAMVHCTQDLQRIRQLRPAFRALLIGVHWPSEPWGEEDFGGPAAFGVPRLNVDAQTDQWADRIAGTPAARQALRTILQAAADDPTPQTMPERVRGAYEALNREAGLCSEGPSGAPGEDRAPFDPERAYQDSFDTGVDFGTGPSLGSLLTPLKLLSFWKMKARARRLGEESAHQLLCRLLTIKGKDHVRFHLMGHSFGCIVVTSMVAGPLDAEGPPRPVSSMALVQGALSHWSFCNDIPVAPGRPGYFWPFIKRHDVAGPVVVTTSQHDRALNFWYPKAAGAAGHVDFDPQQPPTYGAVGIFGVRGPGIDVVPLQMKGANEGYGLKPLKVYNLGGDDVIKQGDFFSGAHSDIAHPEVAHAVWEAVMAAP